MRPEIAEFLAQLGTVRALSPKTIDAYTFDLAKFSQFADREIGPGWRIEDIGQHAIKAYIQCLAGRGNAAITRGRKLATLKSFFGYLSSQGKVKIDPTSQIRMPKRVDKESSYLSEEEYKRLLKAVKDNATKYYKERDIAIVTMLIGTGLRLSELVGLNVGDVTFTTGTIKVILKGRNERTLPLSDTVMTVIRRYLKTRENALPSAPLFLSKRGTRIDSASVQYLVKKYCREAHIEKDGLSPHMLRHSFAAALLKQGENVFTVQQLLAHHNIRTTERYLHINNEDLRTAVSKICLSSS
jgi:integrase/recombinase XerD